MSRFSPRRIWWLLTMPRLRSWVYPDRCPDRRRGLKRGLGKAPSEYPNLQTHDLIKTDYKRIEVQKKTRFFHALILLLCRTFRPLAGQTPAQSPLFLKEECILCKKCIQICPLMLLGLKRSI